MQIRKDETNERILRSAQKLFLDNGFVKTSMRDIASLSQVGLSNMYNYYKSKDEILGELLKPLILELNRMMRDHHDVNLVDSTLFFLNTDVNINESYLKLQVDSYLKLINNYLNQLKLLLFKSQGSSYENFMDDFTDKTTSIVNSFIDSIKKAHPEFNLELTQFTIHMHCVWMFSFLRELIMHEVKPKDMKKIVTDYITFECAGWRELIKK